MSARIVSGFGLLIGLGLAAGVAQAAPQYDDYYGNDGTFRCESDGNRQQRCDADTRGGVQLVRQLSKSSCIQGRTWGYDRYGVWVTDGCRAEFASGRGGGWNGGGGGWGGGGGGWGGGGQEISCESNNNRQNRCNMTVRRDVRLLRQNSGSPCVEGQTWGWDRNGVWVSNGCRGRFMVN